MSLVLSRVTNWLVIELFAFVTSCFCIAMGQDETSVSLQAFIQHLVSLQWVHVCSTAPVGMKGAIMPKMDSLVPVLVRPRWGRAYRRLTGPIPFSMH